MRYTSISPPYEVYYKSFKAPFGFSVCVDGGLELLRLRQVPERSDIGSAASQKRRKGGGKGKGDWIGAFRGFQGVSLLRETDSVFKVKDPSAVMATETTSCTGSTLLQPLSDMIDLPLDQVNCH